MCVNHHPNILAIKFLKSHPLDAIVRASEPSPDWDGRDRRGVPATLDEQRRVPLLGVKFPVHQKPHLDARGHRRKAVTPPISCQTSFSAPPTRPALEVCRDSGRPMRWPNNSESRPTHWQIGAPWERVQRMHRFAAASAIE